MKQFLAVYIGSEAAFERSGWKSLDDETRGARQAAGVKAWMDWVATHAAAIVDPGAPLGTTKRMSADGVADNRNSITGYSIVRAETHEAAARLFENHPHFTIFPGDSVEIMEMLPRPGV